MNICAIVDCNRPAAARGWCKLHWQHWRRNGDPLVTRHEMHGMGSSKRRVPEYTVWAGMKQRCYDKNHHKYYRYGGRGIEICDRWRSSFATFYEDMGARPTPKHSIERIDNDGNYSPQNCRWATYKEQANNKSTNRLLIFNGKALNLREWSELTGIDADTLSWRIQNGFTTKQALTFYHHQRRRALDQVSKSQKP